MMKVVKCLIACVLCGFLGVNAVYAQYDFCERAPSGQMLYYQVIHYPPTRLLIQIVPSVRVTHPEKEWPYYSDNKPVGDLVIPEKVTFEGREYAVVEVGEYAFYRCDSLTGVLGQSVWNVRYQAFCGCTVLKNIMLGTHFLDKKGAYLYCVSIGEGAFAYCRSLERLYLPESVSGIGISAFSMCQGLEEVRMAPEVEKICDATTFHGCSLMQDRKNRKIQSGEPFDAVVWSR